MKYSDLDQYVTVDFEAARLFLERWAPGCTSKLVPASREDTDELAARYRGAALPSVYCAFLSMMGEAVGDLGLVRGTTSISALLHDLDVAGPPEASGRFLKFAIGDDTLEQLQPSYFFDLATRSADGSDAAIVRAEDDAIARGVPSDPPPFASFSDLVRGVFTTNVALDLTKEHVYENLGEDPLGPERAIAFLSTLGFELTELSASRTVIPLECSKRSAIALVLAPFSDTPRTRMYVKSRDEREQVLLSELFRDNTIALLGK